MIRLGQLTSPAGSRPFEEDRHLIPSLFEIVGRGQRVEDTP